MFLAALCFVCVLGTSLSDAAAPEPCATPKQWEGKAWFLDEFGIARSVYMSYDGVNKRVRTSIKLLNGREQGKITEAILLFEENRFYFILHKKEVCVITNALFDFKPAGVPADAVYAYSNIRGFGSNSVKTNTFAKSYEFESPGHHHEHIHSWFASFTDDTCVPVLETIYEGDLLKDASQRYIQLDLIRYTDMTAGIASDKVFDPPDICTKNATSNTKAIDGVFQWHRFMYI